MELPALPLGIIESLLGLLVFGAIALGKILIESQKKSESDIRNFKSPTPPQTSAPPRQIKPPEPDLSSEMRRYIEEMKAGGQAAQRQKQPPSVVVKTNVQKKKQPPVISQRQPSPQPRVVKKVESEPIAIPGTDISTPQITTAELIAARGPEMVDIKKAPLLDRGLFKDPGQLRQAFILSEILGPPRSATAFNFRA